jgi:opacity protein-like surface antigen
MKNCFCVASMAAFYAGAAPAADWVPMLSVTTADVAAAGWELRSSSGLSWPDGRQAVVTFWLRALNTPFTIRCVTAFAADGQQTGSLCKRPSNREIPAWMLDPLANVDEWVREGILK